jgi:hypothetical protein
MFHNNYDVRDVTNVVYGDVFQSTSDPQAATLNELEHRRIHWAFAQDSDWYQFEFWRYH